MKASIDKKYGYVPIRLKSHKIIEMDVAFLRTNVPYQPVQ
jgi:hypothetical protein